MPETKQRTIILDKKQISQKIIRIAHEIYENNFQEKTIYILGVQGEGFILAQRLHAILDEITDFNMNIIQVNMDKKNPLESGLTIELNKKDLKNKVVLLVDDVLNSGKTLMYATKFLLDYQVKSIQTVCLVDRKHRTFPIRADYEGLSLSTTLLEHITVEFGENDLVYLD